jgi:hypothetical protein
MLSVFSVAAGDQPWCGTARTPEVSPIFQSFSLFVLAGLAEIGGGYLMWVYGTHW